MNLKDKVVLSNGVEMPNIGFGTWQMANDKNTEDVLTFALTHGYSHIDTAMAYGNEEQVGKAIKNSNRKREELFITTKLPAEVKDAKEVTKCFERSLKLMRLDYVDLYLIHAPWPWEEVGKDYEKENQEIWLEMEKIYKSGKARSIGVSNFSVDNIKNIMKVASIAPQVNQIGYFIGYTEDEITNYCQANNILVEAYSPLATGRLNKVEELKEIAKKYNKTWAQVALKFCLQNNTVPLPKTNSKERALENIDLDFVITPEDMKYLRTFKQV